MSDISASAGRRSATPRETPEQRAAKKKIQITVGVVLVALVVVLGFYIQTVNPNGAWIWAIGLMLGYVLQRSRFCFTAAIRDPFLTGTTDLTKAVVVALALASIVFAALQIKATGWDLSAVDYKQVKLVGYVQPVGLHTVIGGLLFGIGAVIAGGCASGTLMRMGEGFVQQWITIIFFIVGSILGAYLLLAFQATGFLYSPTAIHLPKLLGGWFPALIIQFGLFFAVYVIADGYGKRKAGEL